MARKGYRAPGWSASGYLKIFEGSYGDGEIRTLAQEPVQNAKDARRGDEVVQVEYRLIPRMDNHGNRVYLLTVTDTGTTGLCGSTNPSERETASANDEERQQLKWYHFERLFDSNKNQLQSGSRGWGKTVFLKCSCIPNKRHSAMMAYDTLLEDGEYRFSDMTIWDDDFGVREQPLLNDEAREAVSAAAYTTSDENVKVSLSVDPLTDAGTRIIVPYVSESVVEAMRNGSLEGWLQYLWWWPIANDRLTITIVDEERVTKQVIREPKWWDGDIWSSDATEPGMIHRLHEGCHILICEDEALGKACKVKRLALLYDASMSQEAKPGSGPDYGGVQLLRAGQSIETFWDFDLIPPKHKAGFRAFVEFDVKTEAKLRERENTQHDRFRRSGIVKNQILPYLKDKAHDFATEIGLIEQGDRNDGVTSERFRRASQFVFARLLSKPLGDIPIESAGDTAAGGSERPWDVDILLSYPNPKTSRVNWGERISGIRFVVNSHPESLRRNTRCAIEWQAPGSKYEPLLTKPFKIGPEYGLGQRILTRREAVGRHEIVCPKAGVYRIRAAVYEGKKLVAKKARRIHVEMDPPVRQEKAVHGQYFGGKRNRPRRAPHREWRHLALANQRAQSHARKPVWRPASQDEGWHASFIRRAFLHARQTTGRGRSPSSAASHADPRPSWRTGRSITGKRHNDLAA